ncbi:MAG: hypothetical protein R2729_01625 [Bryobacteraceae bacterium]
MRRWLIPDVSLAAAAVTLLYGLALFDGPRKLFRDSDTGWHIRTGERILATGSLPRSDPYSFTKAGEPWFAWEWGADVAMGAAHRHAGLGGITLLYLAAIAFCTWLWFRLTWAVDGDFLLACAMASPFLSTTNMHWLARPHVFSWIFLLTWLIVLERAPERFRPSHAVAVAAGATLWANVHASFFLMPVLACMYLLRRPSWYGAATLAAAAGTFLNPYGAGLHRHVAAYLANAELLQRIGEFQTFNFHAEGSWQILLTVMLAAMGGTLALVQGRVHHFLLLFGFLALGLRSARALPVLALLLPLANSAIRQWLASSPRAAQAIRYSGNLRRLELGFRGWAWVPIGLALAYVILQAPAVRTRIGFPPDQFPVAATARLDALVPAGARILAPDKFGGYMIYAFNGRRRVFFDGRSDLYGLDFMKRYIELVQVRPGWRVELARWSPTHALLPVQYSLASALAEAGWGELYRDSTAVLLGAPREDETRR